MTDNSIYQLFAFLAERQALSPPIAEELLHNILMTLQAQQACALTPVLDETDASS